MSMGTLIVLGSFLALTVVVGAVAIGALFGDQVEHYNVAFDVDPKGARIVFSSAKGDLYFLDLRTKKATVLSSSPGIMSSPKFSADGSEIAFSMVDGTGPSASIYEIPAKGGSLRR